MDLYFYKGRLDLAATSLTDLQALIAALADESDPVNAAIISNVTGKVPALVQGDGGEALNLYFYSDDATPATWVADAAVSLAIGLGYRDAATAFTFTSTTVSSIVGSGRVATLALNTPDLANAVGTPYLDRRARREPIYLHIRKTESGVTETVALLPVQVEPGVLSGSPSDAEVTDYVTASELLTAAVLNRPGITSLTGGGTTALDGLGTAPGAAGRLTAGCVVLLSYGLVSQLWKLVAGTDAENVAATPAVVRPDDYNASTNAVVWKQIG